MIAAADVAPRATRLFARSTSEGRGLAAWGRSVLGLGVPAGPAPRQRRGNDPGLRRAPEGVLPPASLLDVTHDAVCVFSLDGVIEFWSSAAEATYGWNAGEAVGRVGHALLQTILPVPLEQIDAQLMRTGRWEGELVHTRKDGTRATVASRWTLQRDAAAAPIAIIEAGHDVTQRKRLETERAELEACLLQAEKLASIGHCASGIAHDFNNILGAILGYGEIAKSKSRTGRPIETELNRVMQAGLRGVRLVERILDVMRSPVRNPTSVHVQSVVEEALRLLSASLPDGVRLEKALSAGDAALWGDPTQLHQVAMNLCTNALHAMPHGGVLSARLDRVAIQEPRTTVHGRLQAGEHVRLAVSDTGTGIARAVRDRIFEPFFTTGTARGTGLGLSLVQRIVEDWQGAIEFESREGVGTTFTVWLPTCGETVPPPVEDSSELPHGNGESVLIVDDEPALVRIAEETLAQLGYHPATFSSGVAALKAFRAEPWRYDIVLAEETMANLTGCQLAREIRKVRPDIPVMLMSGHRGAPMAAEAQAAEVTSILYKPLLSRDFAESIADALRRRA
jgi:PAS domain S-box-containing protein